MERDEALALGLRRYSTGRPCFNGHLSERNTKSGQCLACVRTGPRLKRWGHSGDPEKAKVRAYEWRERNPEKLKFIQWAYAVNKRDAPGRVSYADIMVMKTDECRYCRAPVEELDHILPTTRGGTNYPWNLQFLCQDCNRRKKKRHPLEFEAEEGFYGNSWILFFKPGIIRKSSLICEQV
jgi:5-methylcytosine-specific restriction endonuclease McrA